MIERPTVDLVLPVHNEEEILATSVERLHDYLSKGFPFDWRIVIADSASTDSTLALAKELATQFTSIDVTAVPQKGRGRALRTAWMRSDADVVAYTDVDLSTGLTGLLPLIAPLVSGHSEIAVGSRLSDGAVVARGPKREVISRLYNLLLRMVFAVRFRDAQCGFKALRADVAHRLLPAVRDEAWFFDTELLLLAEHNGLRVHEVPVDWIDDPDSRVEVRSTALEDLRGIRRVLWAFLRGEGQVDLGALERKPLVDDFGRQTVSFLLIGCVSTSVSLVLFLALRGRIGAVGANVISVSATALFNAWANRRWTFRRRGGRGRWWHATGALLAYLAALILSTFGLLLVDGPWSQVGVVLSAWLLAGILRFTVLRSWANRLATGTRG